MLRVALKQFPATEKTPMLYLSEDGVKRVLTLRDALILVEEALKAHALHRAVDVPRERTRTVQGTLHILQGAAPGAGVVGYKAYYATPLGSRSHVYLSRCARCAARESTAAKVLELARGQGLGCALGS